MLSESGFPHTTTVYQVTWAMVSTTTTITLLYCICVLYATLCLFSAHVYAVFCVQDVRENLTDSRWCYIQLPFMIFQLSHPHQLLFLLINPKKTLNSIPKIIVYLRNQQKSGSLFFLDHLCILCVAFKQCYVFRPQVYIMCQIHRM